MLETFERIQYTQVTSANKQNLRNSSGFQNCNSNFEIKQNTKLVIKIDPQVCIRIYSIIH